MANAHGEMCLWLIKSRCPMVRLFNCCTIGNLNYTLFSSPFSPTASRWNAPTLRGDFLDFTEASLLDNLSRAKSLAYLYLLSAATLSDEDARNSMREDHVDAESGHSGRLWRPRSKRPLLSSVVRRGLAKPLNRDFEPVL
ncbi:hypothetical protein MRX96_014757 [Rhipicephalus microplus]